MAKAENNIMRRQLLALSRAGSTVWRQNVGMAWIGRVQKITRRQTVAVQPGDVVIRSARPIHVGLCRGSSDIVGVTPVTIAPQHVGSRMGIFTAVESKDKGRATAEQRQFIDHVNAAGGLAGIARSVAEAVDIISRFKKPPGPGR